MSFMNLKKNSTHFVQRLYHSIPIKVLNITKRGELHYVNTYIPVFSAQSKSFGLWRVSGNCGSSLQPLPVVIGDLSAILARRTAALPGQRYQILYIVSPQK